MKNNKILKKKIIYRANHRGTKEMDLLLGGFVKKYIDNLNEAEINDLEKLLFVDDEIIYKWYFQSNSNKSIPITKISTLLLKFKL